MTIAKDILGGIQEPESSFDAEHYAEWFMAGTLSDEALYSATWQQIDELADNLQERWGTWAADKLDDRIFEIDKPE